MFLPQNIIRGFPPSRQTTKFQLVARSTTRSACFIQLNLARKHSFRHLITIFFFHTKSWSFLACTRSLSQLAKSLTTLYGTLPWIVKLNAFQSSIIYFHDISTREICMMKISILQCFRTSIAWYNSFWKKLGGALHTAFNLQTVEVSHTWSSMRHKTPTHYFYFTDK